MRIGPGRLKNRLLQVTDWSMRSASVVLGGFAKVAPESLPPTLGAALKNVQSGPVIPSVLILTPIVFTLRKKFDNSHLDSVHGLLDQICQATFKHDKFLHEQHGRVTLFRYQYFFFGRWRFWGGWLVPVERSGEATRNTDTAFAAPDNGEASEGVAGMTWSRRRNVSIEGLPNLSLDKSEAAFKKYADMSLYPIERIRKKVPRPLSLYGIPVEVGGKKWGVIVIDSVHPKINTKYARQVFDAIAPTLSSYLRGK